MGGYMGSAALGVLLCGSSLLLCRCLPLLSLPPSPPHTTTMSSAWPSAYGYKYTPIGLRQRERKEDTGKRYFYTSVHLPEGGYLLDIERSYNPDGSVGKKETANNAPGALPALPAIAPAPRAASPFINDLALEPSPRPSTMHDLERQADDIIANFSARRGLPMEKMLTL